MNILIVVRCFPPETGGGRSYRMAKFVKYLSNSGHNITVLSSDEKIDSDKSLLTGANLENINDVRINYKSGKVTKLLTRVIRQISIADGDFYLTYKLIDKLLKTQIGMIPDVVFTSSAPYEVHLVGMYLKKRYSVPWVADFRDPYTLNHNYKSLIPIKKIFDRIYENKIYEYADGVVFNTHMNYEESIHQFKLKKLSTKYIVCQNGYDEDDVSKLVNITTNQIILSYVGGVRGDKQERYFIDQVAKYYDQLKKSNILIRFIGNGSHVFKDVADKYSDVLEIVGFCEQSDLEKYWNESDWLILFSPESAKPLGWVPQKLYTYLSINKPVIAAVPEGEAKKYLKDFDGNIYLQPNNYELNDVLDKLVLNKAHSNLDNSNVLKYEQKSLFSNLVKWLEQEIINA